MPVSDILIIGSGVAGLSLAIKLSKQYPDGKIFIVAKEHETHSNTRHAQGGISVVCNKMNDSFEKHIKDTLLAGDGLCEPDIVRNVVHQAPECLNALIDYDCEFDRDSDGNLQLGREGGHSASRIVHSKDIIGFEIIVSLLGKIKAISNVTILPHHMAIDLITDQNTEFANHKMNNCYGAFILDKKKGNVQKYISRITVLATGGIGQVYRASTNPRGATGDGIAMAHRAGAVICDMEFVQFHPTALSTHIHGNMRFLISEALRGYGAFLVNRFGDQFMFQYHTQGELACRDVVCRAIESEMKLEGGTCVYLDCRHFPPNRLIQDFPNIYEKCKEAGIDITRDLIPVVTAAHYLCGGIKVDGSARTSINNLYAIGECARTGLHGANRLASNSLLEAIAFAEFCFQDIMKTISNISIYKDVSGTYPYSTPAPDLQTIQALKRKAQNIMTSYVGVVRTTDGLRNAVDQLEQLNQMLDERYYPSTVSAELFELRNIVTCAKLIAIQSMRRVKNKGVFYNHDLDEQISVRSV